MPLQLGPLPIKTKEGRVWLQRSPLKPYTLINDGGITNIAWPAPAPTAIRSQSLLTRAGNVVIDITEGDAELPTFTIPTRLFEQRNYLIAIGGERVNVQVLTGPSGDVTQYGASKYGLAWVICMRGSATTDGLASVDNSGEGLPAGFEVPFTGVLGPIPLDWTVSLERIGITDANDVMAVTVLPYRKDPDIARRILPGEVGMFGCAAGAGVPAELYYWKDGLRTAPVATTAQPFGNDVDISALAAYGDKANVRFIAAAASQAGAPAAAAYTDDYGASWVSVTLGADNADVVNALAVLNASRIYGVGGQAGSSKIWMSRDGAASFTELDPGVAQPLNDISVMGNGKGLTGGNSNEVLMCTDFDNWAVGTGPSAGNILTVQIQPSTGIYFVGDSAGKLYASIDQGESWQDISSGIQGVAPTAINHLRFDSATGEFGFMEVTTATDRVVLRTTDGGNTWKTYDLGNGGISNGAKNDLVCYGPNEVMVAGVASGGTGVLLRTQSNFDGGRLE